MSSSELVNSYSVSQHSACVQFTRIIRNKGKDFVEALCLQFWNYVCFCDLRVELQMLSRPAVTSSCRVFWFVSSSSFSSLLSALSLCFVVAVLTGACWAMCAFLYLSLYSRIISSGVLYLFVCPDCQTDCPQCLHIPFARLLTSSSLPVINVKKTAAYTQVNGEWHI